MSMLSYATNINDLYLLLIILLFMLVCLKVVQAILLLSYFIMFLNTHFLRPRLRTTGLYLALSVPLNTNLDCPDDSQKIK